MQKEKLDNDIVYAFKTDTVWGFGCNPNSKIAINKIYEIKKRDKKKPLILMSDSFEFLEKYVQNVPSYVYDLIKKYFPGALTLILEKSKYCLDEITPFSTVGVRVPNSPDFSNLVQKIDGRVLATTSCNLTNEKPVETFFEAKEKFNGVAKIIEPLSEAKTNNIASTVVLCKKEGYEILRQGEIEL